MLARLLAFAGRNGPALLFFGVLIGLAAPSLAQLARPWMGVAVFVFTLGAFLKVDAPAFQAELARSRTLALMLLWAAPGVAAVAWLVSRVPVLPEPVAAGLLLCMLAPPVGSAAAIAAMLDLSPALALVLSVTATAAAPLVLPFAAAWLVGMRLEIDVLQMTVRLLAIVGGAALCAALLRRYASGFVRNPHAMTGIAVAGLLLVAIGAMHGMQPRVLHEGPHVALYLALAFAANAGFQLLGAGVFASLGARDALTLGLVSGNRNITLVWAAAAPALALQPEIELYIAMSVFPIFMLPLVTKRVFARIAATRGEMREAASDATAATAAATATRHSRG